MKTVTKKKPSLRFPEFEDDWQDKKLNSFLIPILREIDKPNESYLAIGIRSHCKGTFQKPNSEPEKIAMDKLFVVKENDLIVNITFAWEGAIAIVKKSDEGGLVSHRFPTYTFEENVSSHNFFQFIFTQKKFRTTLDLISPGGAGRNRVLSKKDFLKIKVNLPKLPEQQKIAAFLTAVAEKIQQLTKKKVLLEQYKKGVMQKIFNQEIRFKDDDGNDFADWEEKKLGEACQINPKSQKLPKSFVYIDLESVGNGILTKENIINLEDAPSRAQRLLETNDILYQTVRPYQKNNLFFEKDGIYVASTGYAQIRTKNDSKFIYHYLHSENFVNKVLLRCTGTSYPAINSTDLSNIKISLPSLPEQKKIAIFLSAIEDKINFANQQLEKTQTFKKGLLQQMFI